MFDILEYLFKIYVPDRKEYDLDFRYREKLDEAERLERELSAKLPDDLHTELLVTLETVRAAADLETTLAFIDGFVLGARIFMAVLPARESPK